MNQPTEDKRKIWQVHEMDGRTVICGQTRYIPAISRKEAKEIYEKKYKKYPTTHLTAIVIGWHMSEWVGEES